MLSVSHIVMEVFWPTLLYSMGTVYWGLQHWFTHSSLKVHTTGFQWGWVLDFDWTIATPWFFPFSDILLYICCCDWDHCLDAWQLQLSFSCWRDGLTFDSRIFWYTEEFIVDTMTARCPGPVGVDQYQIISPPPLCLTVCMRCLWWYAVFGFL